MRERTVEASQSGVTWLSWLTVAVFYLCSREWVIKSGMLIAMSVYTYLRLIVDHHGSPTLLALRQKEVDFCIGLLREKVSRKARRQDGA